MQQIFNLFTMVILSFLASCSSDHKPEANSSRETVSDSTQKPSKLENIRYIYLTFDDGPLQGSENIDSIVLAERIKINVFLVGQNIVHNPLLKHYYELYEQNPFIEEYNHSYSHANGKYEVYYDNPQRVLADIRKNEAEYNLRYKIVRLPGRNMWRIRDRKKSDVKSGSSSADLLAENGYKVFGWDLEWQHNTDGSPIQSVNQMQQEIENMFKNKQSFTKGHVVILMHDEMFNKKWEESELKQLIDKLRENPSYIFEHISFYPSK